MTVDFINAQDALAYKKFDEAKRLMERGAAVLGVDAPSPVLLVEHNLTVAGVSIRNAEGPRALEASEIALGQLQAGQGGFTGMNWSYLIAYAEVLIAYCEEWRDRTPAIQHVNVKHIDFRKVSDSLRRSYPLPPSGTLRMDVSTVQPYSAAS